MTIIGRPYIDASGTPRTLEVDLDDASGRDRFGYVDVIAHGKLDSVNNKMDNLNTTLGNKLDTVATKLDSVNTTLSSSYLAIAPNPTTVSTTLATVLDIDCQRWRRLSLRISNTGAAALTVFRVQTRYTNTDTTFFTRLSDPTDYTTNTVEQSGNAARMAIAASGNLNVLAANGSGWLELNVERVAAIRVIAQVASGSTTLAIAGIAKE